MLNKDYGNVKSTLKIDVGFVKLRLSECKEWVKIKLILSKIYVKSQISAHTSPRDHKRNIKLT